MEHNNVETALALEALRAPLNPAPITIQEQYLHEMRVKYRSYFVEYNANEGAIKMPTMFTDDFGNDLCRVVTLVDSGENQFECLVEKINGNVYFTRGWAALRDFYDIRLGAWLILLYMGGGQIGVIVQDRFQQLIPPPLLDPPVKFTIDMFAVPTDFVNDLPESTRLLSYSHDDSFFHISHEKSLTLYDISTGFLMLPHAGFGEFAFDEDTTSVKLVDDCGNLWNCDMIFVTMPFKHFKIGGEWSKMVAARRLTVGESIRVGVRSNGHAQVVYLMFNH